MKINLFILTILSSLLVYSVNTSNSNLINSTNKLSKKLIQPDFLKNGDTIALVAPAGILNNFESKINIAKRLFEDWGLNVVVGNNIYNRNGHFAGTDNDRITDLQKVLDDKSIKAIWCIRGGYGTIRIIDYLNFDKFIKNPKWIIGFSDITVLHNKLNIMGYESIHGMMISNIDEIKANHKSLVKLKSTLFGDDLNYIIKSNEANKIGKSNGIIVGGNLTLIHSTVGSDIEISTNNKILFLEEIGEHLYKIDRMLYSLKRAGYFDECKGLIIGQISDIKNNSTEFGMTINELILDLLKEYDFPVIFDFPAGHEIDNYPIILGRNINIKVKKSKTEINF